MVKKKIVSTTKKDVFSQWFYSGKKGVSIVVFKINMVFQPKKKAFPQWLSREKERCFNSV